MSSGRRYNNERKLNMKKVVGVIIAIAVIIMIFISIKKLLEPKPQQETTGSVHYFTAYQNSKWGVINQAGIEVIPFVYDEMIIVPDSSKDIFITTTDVNMETGEYKTKVFNRKNEEIFATFEQVEAIDNYDESQNLWYEKNVLKVKKDGKYGLINFNGVQILDCKYDDIYSLKGTTNSLIIKLDEKVGIVSNVGDIIVPAEYKEVKAAGDNYASGYIAINEEGKQGLIGSNKKTVLDTIYEDIKQVSGNGLYCVKEDGILKIINEAKEVILDQDFDDILQIDGENLVLKRGDNVGIITTSKEEKIPFEYQELESIGNNHFIAKKDNQYGVVDGNNQTIIDFTYNYIWQRKDTDFIEAEKDATQTDIYSKDMEIKLTGIVSDVNTEKGYISIRIGDEQEYYNFKFEKKEAKDFYPSHTLFLTKQNGKYGYKNAKGDLVVDYIYDDAKEQNEYGFSSVKLGNVWGSLNKDGNVSLQPSVNLENNLVIDFIGNWHLSEDLNLYYYEM